MVRFFLSFKIVVSMDLVSMVVNDKEPMKIILLIYFEIKSTVMGFHEQLRICYWRNFENMYEATKYERSQ